MSGNPIDKKKTSLLLKNASGLTARQSVRVTFRLSSEFIEALRILSAQLGIKQKSLFDHLLEDVDALQAVARAKQPVKAEDRKARVQKTFVVSKKSLLSLAFVSRELATPRDDLVELAIQRLLPVLLTERQQQKKREEAFLEITAHFEQSLGLLKNIKTTVGAEDPLFKNLAAAIESYRNAYDNMRRVVEKGKKITDLSLERFRL